MVGRWGGCGWCGGAEVRRCGCGGGVRWVGCEMWEGWGEVRWGAWVRGCVGCEGCEGAWRGNAATLVFWIRGNVDDGVTLE